MTLGDLIKNYLEQEGNTMTDFSKESGLSRAYAYMLLKNKNNSGGQIVPSLETIKKVSKGIHTPFDAVISMLDRDIIVRMEPQDHKEQLTDEEKQIITAYRKANEMEKRMVHYVLRLLPLDEPYEDLK